MQWDLIPFDLKTEYEFSRAEAKALLEQIRKRLRRAGELWRLAALKVHIPPGLIETAVIAIIVTVIQALIVRKTRRS